VDYLTHCCSYNQRRSKKKKVRGAKLKKIYFKKIKILNILQRKRLGKISLQGSGPLPASATAYNLVTSLPLMIKQVS
jgi:hypothetical protein